MSGPMDILVYDGSTFKNFVGAKTNDTSEIFHNSTSGNIHKIEFELNTNVHLLVWYMSGLFVLTSLYVSLRLIRAHLRNFSQPLIQSKIVGILWMVPIYAIDSWISLRFKNLALYLDMCRDCYEAYAIYLFLSLMITYIGNGNEECVIEILQTLPNMPHPFPFNYCNRKIKMGRAFLLKCKTATLQFVVLKPLVTLTAIFLHASHLYEEGQFRIDRGYIYLTVILNISISYAFYYLVLFYLALSVQLTPYKPIPKFLCIKAVLFLSFWQSVLIACLAKFNLIHEVGSWTTQNVVTGIQNLLICIEMCLAAYAHQFAFPYDIFKGKESIRSTILEDNLDIKTAVRDFNEVMPLVLPTGFQPGPATIMRKGLIDEEDVNEPISSIPQGKKKLLGIDIGLLSESDDSDNENKGWRY